jgi:hypothetical protein
MGWVVVKMESKNLRRKFVRQNFKMKIIFAQNAFGGHYSEKNHHIVYVSYMHTSDKV